MEASPLGYKLVEAYQDKSVGFRFIKDKDKAVELKKLEKEPLENVEYRSRYQRRAGIMRSSRSGSRSESKSPRRS